MEIGFFTRTEIKRKRGVSFLAPTKVKQPLKKLSLKPLLEDSKDSLDISKQGCEYCPVRGSERLVESGSANPELYFLGGYATQADYASQQVFSDRFGKYLKKHVTSRSRFGYCCKCFLGEKVKIVLQTPELWCCRKNVVEDIEKTKPAVVVGVGPIPLQFLEQTSIVACRGRFVPVRFGKHVCWYFSLLDPKFVLSSGYKDEDWEATFKRDMYYLQSGHYLKFGKPRVLDVNMDKITLVTPEKANLEVLQDFLNSRKGQATAVDIETTHLRPYYLDSHILSIAIGDDQQTVAFPYDHPNYRWSDDDQVLLNAMIKKFVLSNDSKYCHNVAFELEWFADKVCSEVLKGRCWNDTMVQAYVLDERFHGLSLDFVALQYLGIHLKQASDIDRTRMIQYGLDELLNYNALDSKYTYLLYQELCKRLCLERLEEVYDFQIERIPVLVGAQRIGVPVIPENIVSIENLLDTTLSGIEKSIDGLSCVKEFKKVNGSFNPASSQQVLSLMNDFSSVSKRIKTTGKEVLSKLANPVANLILDYRKYAKLRSTYLSGYKEGGKYVFPDNRVHTVFNSVSTVTGRLSSGSPNLQNFPKRQDEFMRAILGAPEGFKMVCFDYGQIEARVVAMMSKDPIFVEALWNNYDIHMVWAEKLARRCVRAFELDGNDIRAFRSTVKNVFVFPLIYGATSDSIARNMMVSGSVIAEFAESFWDQFSGIKAWQNRLSSFYKDNGFVSCLTGRRRRGPLSTNQLYNAPVQGTASDIVVDAMVRLSRLSYELDIPWLHPVVNIHDDLMFFMPKDKLEQGIEVVIDEMLAAKFSWINVPLSTEVRFGQDWANLIKIGAFSSNE